MFARVNIRAEVDAIPSASFFPRVGNLEFSFFFNSWGHGSSGGMTTMRTLLGGFDRERGLGASNRGRYSNPEVDRNILAALETVDDARREEFLREATAIAMRDVAVLPVHQLSNFWATRAQVAYEPRRDGFTLATKTRAV
jgi:peptide/nickel transport system substrate-binding protein